MTKEEMITFIKENHCDIEAYPVSNVMGELPPPERQLNSLQREELLKKARVRFGYRFEFFLGMNMAGSKKNITESGFELISWIDHRTWDAMHRHWLGFERSWNVDSDRAYRIYKGEEEYQAPDED
jgi:hypothetical protein